MSLKTDLIQPDRGQDAIAIHLVNKDGFEDFTKKLSGPQRAALAGQKFTGGGYQVGIVPDGEGWFAVGGVANPDDLSAVELGQAQRKFVGSVSLTFLCRRNKVSHLLRQ